VAIKNTDTGITRTVITNADGFYVAPNLQPGRYEVTCTAKSFTAQRKTGINVTVGAEVVLNLKLSLANVAQRIEVTAQSNNVELATSDLGPCCRAQPLLLRTLVRSGR
jgi:hypothetical protein